MSQDLDLWDPLSEEFNSPSFNCYNEGPGVNLPLGGLPSFATDGKVKQKTRTLCIKNVPVDLTEVGVRNLFSNCGKVLSVSKLHPKPEYPDKTIAFVDYGTTEEALHAIQRLHDRPPFFLKVTLATMAASDRSKMEARLKEELDEIRRKVEAERAKSEVVTAPCQPSADGGVVPAPAAGKSLPASAKFTLEDLKDAKTELGLGSRRRRSGSASSSSSSSGDSFKTTCEFPGGSSSDATLEDEVLVIRGSGDGEATRFFKRREGKGRCLFCKAPADLHCARCKMPYCSRKCQTKDWPSHEDVCHQQSSSRQLTVAEASDGILVSRSHPSDQTQARVGADASPGFETSTGIKPITEPEAPKSVHLEPATLPIGEEVEVIVSHATNPLELFLQQTSSQTALEHLQAELQKCCGTSDAGHDLGEGTVCAALFPEDNQWYRARVTARHNAQCTVYFVDYGNSATVAVSNTRPLPVGCTFLAEQAVRCGLHGLKPPAGGSGTWSDGAILELATMLTGRLLARAVELSDGVHKVELRRIGGQDFAGILVSKGLAESTISPAVAPRTRGLDPVRLQAVLNPQAKSKQQPQPDPQPKPQSNGRFRVSSILELVKPGEELTLQVMVSRNNEVWVLVMHPEGALELASLEQELNEQCPKMARGSSYTFATGDYVASKSLEDGRWYRARVTSTNPACRWVRYIDYGNDELNTSVVPLDEKQLKVAAMSARLEVGDCTVPSLGSSLTFVVESSAGDGLLCGKLVCDDGRRLLGSATLSPWDCGLAAAAVGTAAWVGSTTSAGSTAGKSEGADPAVQPVTKTGSKLAAEVAPTKKLVVASPVSSRSEARVLHLPQCKLPSTKRPMIPTWKTEKLLYLQRCDLQRDLQAMMAELNSWVQRTPHNTPDPLAVGDYVCALYSGDKTWYRGQVLSKRSEEGAYAVSFVDYGNSETVPAASLRRLPPRFAEWPVFAVAVVPQGVDLSHPRLEAVLTERPFAAVEVGLDGEVPLVRLVRKDGSRIGDLLSATAGAEARNPACTRARDSPSSYGTRQPRFILTAAKEPLRDVVVLSRTARMWEAARSFSKLQLDRGRCVFGLHHGVVESEVVESSEWACTVRRKSVQSVPTRDVQRDRRASAEDAVDPLAILADDNVAAVDVHPKLVGFVADDTSPADESRFLQVSRLAQNAPIAVFIPLVSSKQEPSKKAFEERPLPPGLIPATVTHVSIANGRFYLQQSSTVSSLATLMKELDASVATAPAISPSALSVRDVLCARYAADGLWYRATLVGLSDDSNASLKVNFVDFGNTENVGQADVRALPERFRNTPSFANCVVLCGVKSVGKECAEKLIGAKVSVEVVDGSCHPPKVSLFANGVCLNELIE
ncbi:unnamed protein product [Ixodes pacificus]